MASIGTNKSGSKCIRFFDQHGDRKTLHIGKVDKRTARLILVHVERLASASKSRCGVPDETANWVGSLGDEMRSKMANVGLIAARETMTLEGFIEQYIAGRNDSKQTTKTVWSRAKRHMLAFFGGSRPLRGITKTNAKGFRQYLIGMKSADNTVRRTCGIAKQFFADALDRDRPLVDENPFKQKSIPTTTGGNPERQAYISHETAKAVLNACPDSEWRLLFALARFAGLRCPSESLLLRWEDIHWDRNRMTVRSPKTEHHEGGSQRVVPIFPELKPYLEESFEQAKAGSVYVIERYRGGDTNTGTQLQRIIEKAGVKQWPKLWQNLRASCETDLARIHPIKAVCDWIGNSVSVAQRHYLQTTEDDFDRASSRCQNPRQSVAENGGNDRTAFPKALGKSLEPSVSPSRRMGDEGLEPDSATRLNDNDLRQSPSSSLPESGPSGVVLPPEVWETLPESLRASLMSRIRDIERGDAM